MKKNKITVDYCVIKMYYTDTVGRIVNRIEDTYHVDVSTRKAVLKLLNKKQK